MLNAMSRYTRRRADCVPLTELFAYSDNRLALNDVVAGRRFSSSSLSRCTGTIKAQTTRVEASKQLNMG